MHSDKYNRETLVLTLGDEYGEIYTTYAGSVVEKKFKRHKKRFEKGDKDMFVLKKPNIKSDKNGQYYHTCSIKFE